MDIKKRILINATCDIQNPTGLAVFTRELVTNLIKLCPELFDVLCINDFFPNNTNKRLVSKYYSPDYGTIGNLLRWTWNQTFLLNDYKKGNYSLLLSTVHEAPIAVRNKAIVIHDILPVKFPEIYPRLKYYFYYILPKILNTSKHIFFDSKSSKNEVFNYFNLKDISHSIIYPGYNKKLFFSLESGIIKKKYGVDKYFCYVGDMRPYKNLKNAILAFAEANIDDLYFLIAGKKDKKFFPQISSLVAALKLEKKVLFLNYIPLEDLPFFYGNAIALFFPSRYEGFGLPALEAMATGAPVITTKLTSLPEVCDNAAIYIDPDNINEMAIVLKKLYIDLNFRQNLSNLSLKRAEYFSWERTAKLYYDELVNLSKMK